MKIFLLLNVLKKQKLARKSEPNQEMELDDFNDLINTYAIIREKKNGGFSAAKATDFSSGDNINQSNEHKKPN